MYVCLCNKKLSTDSTSFRVELWSPTSQDTGRRAHLRIYFSGCVLWADSVSTVLPRSWDKLDWEITQ